MADSSFCSTCRASVETPRRESRHPRQFHFLMTRWCRQLRSQFTLCLLDVVMLLDKRWAAPTTRGSERFAGRIGGRYTRLQKEQNTKKDRIHRGRFRGTQSGSKNTPNKHTRAHSGLVRFVKRSVWKEEALGAHSEVWFLIRWFLRGVSVRSW